MLLHVGDGILQLSGLSIPRGKGDTQSKSFSIGTRWLHLHVNLTGKRSRGVLQLLRGGSPLLQAARPASGPASQPRRSGRTSRPGSRGRIAAGGGCRGSSARTPLPPGLPRSGEVGPTAPRAGPRRRPRLEFGAEAPRREGPFPAPSLRGRDPPGQRGLGRLPVFQAAPQHLASHTTETLDRGPTTGSEGPGHARAASCGSGSPRARPARRRVLPAFPRQRGARPGSRGWSRREPGVRFRRAARLGPAKDQCVSQGGKCQASPPETRNKACGRPSASAAFTLQTFAPPARCSVLTLKMSLCRWKEQCFPPHR